MDTCLGLMDLVGTCYDSEVRCGTGGYPISGLIRISGHYEAAGEIPLY